MNVKKKLWRYFCCSLYIIGVYYWLALSDWLIFVIIWRKWYKKGLSEHWMKYIIGFILGLLSTNGQRRFHAMLGAPLFLMSCLSNFYFFTGMQVCVNCVAFIFNICIYLFVYIDFWKARGKLFTNRGKQIAIKFETVL